ncbi:MAG: GntR family transcriptional regulator [Rhodobacteraceae bacterium]|nr:GntR family transcriptional regulator [Paracoccaceae bacterium]TVR45896.1 MAG: GntR family transcriptional regulator [Paracoccaceae bacterium]
MASDTLSQTQKALLDLRQRILSGAIIGGTRLYEVALAEELATSRTPVRAALSRLAEEGLLERGRGGGFVVRSFALADVVDTIDLRGVLEGTAARYAAERGIGPEDMAQAQATLREIDRILSGKTLDMEAYSRLNTRFHAILAQMSQSTTLQRELARITALPFASPSAFLEDHNRPESLQRTMTVAQAQHHAILEAIVARESARAEAVTREHARAARRNVEFLLSQEAALREGVPSLALLNN